MFFIMGLSPKEEILEYKTPFKIHSCGKYQKIEITRVSNVLYLFFIPTFKFGKKYYATYTCCGEVYEISKNLGEEIERNSNIDLRKEDMRLISKGQSFCPKCGYPIDNSFEFCPKCGERI